MEFFFRIIMQRTYLLSQAFSIVIEMGPVGINICSNSVCVKLVWEEPKTYLHPENIIYTTVVKITVQIVAKFRNGNEVKGAIKKMVVCLR